MLISPSNFSPSNFFPPQIDFSNLVQWTRDFLDQSYYLLPLCIHVTYKIPLFANIFTASSPHWSWLLEKIPHAIRNLNLFGYILTPLVSLAVGGFCIDSKNTWCLFPGAPYFHRVLQCNIVTDPGESRGKDVGLIRQWVMNHEPAADKSSHWWYYDLNNGALEAFDRCANSSQILSMFRSLFSERHYCLDVIQGMNEVYVTGPNRKKDDASNSDNVFYTRHVDGPLGFVPFVSVYRCIVGMDRNMMITTHFPLAKISVNACQGDVLAFDFNREVHYIENDDSKKDESDDYRVVLKLHYCVYPRFLAPLGWLMHLANVRYNQNFRALFLKTISPQSPYEHFLAWNVNAWTILYDLVETNLGLRNIIYLLFLSAAWYCTGSYTIFFALTSYVHYLRYISTFYIRRGIDFGSFKRDVFLFKTLALSQLFYHYLFPSVEKFQFSAVSVGMVFSGYVVSMLATHALGIDRTYFAAELGLVPPKWITQFPYGYIPHPMIVSQIWALVGFHMAPHFRAEWPLVVPIHCLLYVTHMLQEHFDLYKKWPTEGKKIR